MAKDARVIDDKTTIHIPIEWYDTLEKAKILLDCLQANGVDNWDYYSDALNDAEKILEKRQPVISNT